MKDIRELLQTRPLLLMVPWVLIIRRLPGWSASRPT